MILQILGPGYFRDLGSQYTTFSSYFLPGGYQRSISFLISRLLPFVTILAGLYFFVKLVSAGYSYLTSAGDPGKIQNATKEITNALIGLILIISSYFIVQLIQVVFGLTIL